MATIRITMLLAAISGAAFGQSSKQPIDHPVRKDPPTASVRADAMRAIRTVLPQLELSSVPLNDALQQLADRMQVNLTARWGRLEAAGVPRDADITLSLKQVTFRDALVAILDQTASGEELAFRVTSDMVLVSTLADINSEMIVRVYEVGDLNHRGVEPSLFVGKEFTYVQSIQPVVDENAVAPMPVIGRIPIGVSFGGTGSDAPELDLNTGQFEPRNEDEDQDEPEPGAPGTIEDLIRVIVATVEPQSWRENGGQGTITAFKDQLVVRNSLYVHQLLGGIERGR